MHYFYAIQSKNNSSFYKGISSDPLRRLKEHNRGKTHSTKPYRPYKIVFVERHKTLAEVFYKTGQGRDILKNKIENAGVVEW